MFRKLAVTGLAAVVGLFPAGAARAGEAGTVDLLLDGVAQVWMLADHDPDAPDPDLHFRDFGFVWQASLIAVGPLSLDAVEGDPLQAPTLVITFSGFDGEIDATEASILLTTAPDGRRYVSVEGDESLVHVDMLELLEDVALADGAFEARLCFRERLFTASDPEDCVDVSGRFSARLPREGS